MDLSVICILDNLSQQLYMSLRRHGKHGGQDGTLKTRGQGTEQQSSSTTKPTPEVGLEHGDMAFHLSELCRCASHQWLQWVTVDKRHGRMSGELLPLYIACTKRSYSPYDWHCHPCGIEVWWYNLPPTCQAVMLLVLCYWLIDAVTHFLVTWYRPNSSVSINHPLSWSDNKKVRLQVSRTAGWQ